MASIEDSIETSSISSTIKTISKSQKTQQPSTKTSNKSNKLESAEFDFSDRQNEYSDSFDSDRSTLAKKYVNPKDSEKIYSDTFESLDSAQNKTETRLTNKNDFSHLKSTDYGGYLIRKIKYDIKQAKNKDESPKIPTSRAQIHRLISNIQKNVSKDAEPIEKSEDFKINTNVINKLKTQNTIKRIFDEQIEKINSFGNNIRPLGEIENAAEVVEKRIELSKQAYIRSKMNQIKVNNQRELIENHEMFYADSIMLIGDLAKCLPKPSDPPEIIWDRFLKKETSS
jgi:hypothetical protein